MGIFVTSTDGYDVAYWHGSQRRWVGIRCDTPQKAQSTAAQLSVCHERVLLCEKRLPNLGSAQLPSPFSLQTGQVLRGSHRARQLIGARRSTDAAAERRAGQQIVLLLEHGAEVKSGL